MESDDSSNHIKNINLPMVDSRKDIELIQEKVEVIPYLRKLEDKKINEGETTSPLLKKKAKL